MQHYLCDRIELADFLCGPSAEQKSDGVGSVYISTAARQFGGSLDSGVNLEYVGQAIVAGYLPTLELIPAMCPAFQDF